MKTYTSSVVNIDDIKPYEKNSREHSDMQLEQIMQSIIEFGFTNPLLVDSEYNLIAGHGRLEAVKRLNRYTYKDSPVTALPCIIVDGLTESQKKALVIADNSIALNATWNEELLKQELNDIQASMPIFFFDNNELDKLFEETNELVQEISTENEKFIPNIDVKPNEHWDYICFVFSNLQDWLAVCAKLGVSKAYYDRYDSKGKAIKKVGVGRMIKGEKLLDLLEKNGYQKDEKDNS